MDAGQQVPWVRRHPFVTVVPALLVLLIQLPPTIAIGMMTATPTPWVIAKAAIAAASALGLLMAWRHPGPALTAIAPLGLALLFLPPQVGPPPVALAIALVIAVVRAAPVWSVATAGGVWVIGVGLAEIIGPTQAPQRIVGGTFALAVCLAIGLVIRRRAERMRRREHDLAERRRRAEQDERDQIARELHDVLAHSLSQISVQSGVGLHLFDGDPEQAREALRNIRALSGTGLEEARGVLASLRGEEAPLTPQPELADLPALLEQHRALGLDVQVEDALASHDPARSTGMDPAPSGRAQSAAYRIIREALTNVVRHSSADRADVRLRRDGPMLVVEIEDDGTGTGTAQPGAGMRSMRDRAELAGGALQVIPGARGRGTCIRAQIPWTEEAR